MKPITRKQFFQRFTGGLLALGATAVGKDIDSTEHKPTITYDSEVAPVGSKHYGSNGKVYIKTNNDSIYWEGIKNEDI